MGTRWTKYVALFLLGAAPLIGADPNLNGIYTATAYAQKGITASGQYAHQHVVAADPAVLPIGTRIKIRHAGRYSGEYVVADTGDKIAGHKLDIYLPSVRACRHFGVKRVNVSVIEVGSGTHEAAKQADQAVKQDVQKDVQKGVVGNAATEADWATKGAPVAAAASGNPNPEPGATPSKKAAASKRSTASSTTTSTSSSTNSSTNPK